MAFLVKFVAADTLLCPTGWWGIEPDCFMASKEALEGMAAQYPGKTLTFSHDTYSKSALSGVVRSAEVVSTDLPYGYELTPDESEWITLNGGYFRLETVIAITDGNIKDLFNEQWSPEVSINADVGVVTCPICETDLTQGFCDHVEYSWDHWDDCDCDDESEKAAFMLVEAFGHVNELSLCVQGANSRAVFLGVVADSEDAPDAGD